MLDAIMRVLKAQSDDAQRAADQAKQRRR